MVIKLLTLFLLFCIGVLFYCEVYPGFVKVDCPVPSRYTVQDIEENTARGDILGFSTELSILLLDKESGEIIVSNIYGWECVALYKNLYWAGGRKDHELRRRGKEMESL